MVDKSIKSVALLVTQSVYLFRSCPPFLEVRSLPLRFPALEPCDRVRTSRSLHSLGMTLAQVRFNRLRWLALGFQCLLSHQSHCCLAAYAPAVVHSAGMVRHDCLPSCLFAS